MTERFGRDPSEVGRARHIVSVALRAWGFDADVAAVELATSELVSNALRHGDGPVEVRISAERDRIRLEVHDQGGGQPVLRDGTAAAGEPGGWGLQFVEQLSDDWGAASDGGGTRVWMVRRAGG